MSSAIITAPEFLPFIGGEPIRAGDPVVLHAPYDGTPTATVYQATPDVIERAIAAARAAAPRVAALSNFQRAELLENIAQLIRRDKADFSALITAETGKPIREAQMEVDRSVQTLIASATAARELRGEVVPLDSAPIGAGRMAFTIREPRGVIGIITPFNFPLNLVAHKIAPALACGCPFVLKPASTTPIGALTLGEILAETDLPGGAFSILPLDSSHADALVIDERIKKLSFTGSTKVGWELRNRASKKHVTMELGGNAACVVERDADLQDAVDRNVFGGYYQSGQSCISVQRIFAHEGIYAALRDQLVTATRALRAGDPKDESTFVGPLITEADAVRILDWIQSAVRRGARVLCAGERRGAVLEPALLENVPADEPLCAREVFGPVAILVET